MTSDTPRTWLPLVPVFVMALVAAGQIYLASTGPLSPWKGGGFGMFSSNDNADNRLVRVWGSGPGPSEEIEVPPELVVQSTKVLIYPSRKSLAELGREIPAVDGRELTRVRVGVWRRDYDPRTLEVSWAPLEEVVVEVADPAP